MINATIFSKDRPCQIDLLLRSLKLYYVGWKEDVPTIIYKHTDETSRLGYDIVKAQHPEFKYVCQNESQLPFKTLVENSININNTYTMFFVDDQVFKDTFILDCPEFLKFIEDQDILSLSLRLCPRMDYCYPIDRHLPTPSFLPDRSWYWRQSHGDWQYPLSLDSDVLRTKEVLPLIKEVQFTDPNSFEGQLSMRPLPNNRMICFQESKVFNVPANRVQNTSLNRHGNIPVQGLNELFLQGKRISLKNLTNIQNRAPHHEVEFILE